MLRTFVHQKAYKVKRTTNWEILITYIKDQHPNYKEKFYKSVKIENLGKRHKLGISLPKTQYIHKKMLNHVKNQGNANSNHNELALYHQFEYTKHWSECG